MMQKSWKKNVFTCWGRSSSSNTRMDALSSGTLGMCAYYVGSYAIIHFIVFVRHFTDK